MSSAFQTLEQRYAETDAADDLGLRPEELYLTAEELRARIDSKQRVELRALGRTVAAMDQELALEAEAPKISVGKERGRKRPLFLFPHALPPLPVNGEGMGVGLRAANLSPNPSPLRRGEQMRAGCLRSQVKSNGKRSQ